MKKITIFMLLVFTAFLKNYSQELKVVVYDPPKPYIGNLGDWGTDLLLSNTEPFGKFSGVVRPTDTLYVAVPDTNIIAGSCLVILRSTNNGTNWSATVSISPATIISKTRMVRSGLDSIYCMFLFGAG